MFEQHILCMILICRVNNIRFLHYPKTSYWNGGDSHHQKYINSGKYTCNSQHKIILRLLRVFEYKTHMFLLFVSLIHGWGPVQTNTWPHKPTPMQSNDDFIREPRMLHSFCNYEENTDKRRLRDTLLVIQFQSKSMMCLFTICFETLLLERKNKY